MASKRASQKPLQWAELMERLLRRYEADDDKWKLIQLIARTRESEPDELARRAGMTLEAFEDAVLEIHEEYVRLLKELQQQQGDKK